MSITRIPKYEFSVSQSISGSFRKGDTVEASFLAKGNSTTINQYISQTVDLKYSVSSASINLQAFGKGTFPEAFNISNAYVTKSFTAGIPVDVQYIQFTLSGSLDMTGSNTYNSGGAANYDKEVEVDYDAFKIQVHTPTTELTDEGLLVFTSPNKYIKADSDGITIKGGEIEAEKVTTDTLEVYGDATIFGDVTATANIPYDETPQAVGLTGTTGEEATFARGDHRHELNFATLDAVVQEGQFANVSGSEASTGSFGASYIDNKLGIGQKTPLAPLDVAGNIYSDGQLLVDVLRARSGGEDFELRTSNAGTAITFTDSSQNNLMYISSSGNVGIGTATPEASGGLHIHQNRTMGSTSNFTKARQSSSLLISQNSTHFMAIDANEMTNYGGDLYLGALGDAKQEGNIYFRAGTTSLSTRMYMSASGYLGIGTTKPTHRLSVAGDISASGNIYLNGNRTIGTSKATNNLTIDPQANLYLGTVGTDGIYIGRTDNLNRIYLQSGGANALVVSASKIGINYEKPGYASTTTAPNLKLEINGDVTIQDEHLLCFDHTYYNHGFMKMTSNTRLLQHGYYGQRFTSYGMGGTTGTDGRLIMYLSGSVSPREARVGIGTDEPTKALQVSGDISASGDIYLRREADIIFGEGSGTRIYENGSDLTLESDDDLVLMPDDDLIIGQGSTAWATFLGDEREFRVAGNISASGDIHLGGQIKASGSLSIVEGNDIIFNDLNTLSSSNPSTIHWDLPNDDVYIYAQQSSSDATSFIFESKDNITTDQFVFWFNDYQGATKDSFPLKMDGNKFVVNYYYDRRATYGRDGDNAVNGPANNVDFYLLKSGSSGVSKANSLIFGDVSDSQVTINGDITASGNISASGTQHIFGGKVGIGTTSPNEHLHVQGDSNQLAQFTSTDNRALIEISDNDTFGYIVSEDNRFQMGGSSSLSAHNLTVRTDSGRVGIGTTSPGEKLEVVGDISASGNITALSGSLDGGLDVNGNVDIDSGDLTIGNSFKFGNNGIFTFGASVGDGTLTWDTGYASLYGQSGNKLRLGSYGTQGVLTISSSHENTMVISGSGVGIGTTSPTTLFHIHKEMTNNADNSLLTLQGDIAAGDLGTEKVLIDFTMTDNNDNNYPQVKIGAAVGRNADADSLAKEGSGAFVVYTSPGSSNTDAEDNTTERMRVDYLGNVGIGTTTPGHKLSVDGDISASGMYITSSTGLVFDRHGHEKVQLGVGNSDRFQIRNQTDGRNDLVILDSGEVGIGGNDSPPKTLTVAGDISSSGDLYLENAKSIYFGNPNITNQHYGKIYGTWNELDITHPQGAYEAGIRINTQGQIIFANVHDGGLDFSTDQKMILSMSRGDGTSYFGIGNINPTKTLTAEGDISASGDLFIQDSAYLATDRGERVGIGTTSPTQALDVAGKIAISSGSAIADYVTTNFALRRGSDGSGQLDAPGNILVNIDTNNNQTDAYFGITKDAGTEIFRVQEDGKVGIGNTSPNYLLHVGDDVGLSFSTTPDKAIGLLSTTDDHEVAYIIGVGEGTNNIRSKYFVDDDTKYVGWDATYSTGLNGYQWQLAGSPLMTLLAGGNFGIGMTNPTEKLQLVSGGKIKLDSTSQDTGSILFKAHDADAVFSTYNDSATGDPQQFILKHNLGDTELINRRGDLILSASGNIGIGTNTATKALVVEGDISASGHLYLQNGKKLYVDEIESPTQTTNKLILEDDQSLASNMVSLQAVNFINLMVDGNDNGTGGLNIMSGSYDADTAKTMVRVETETGNVGIGTTSPGFPLDVTNTSEIGLEVESSYAGPSGLRVKRTSGDTVALLANYSGYGGGLASTDALRFGVNDSGITSPSMYIETDGNVGINTTSPSEKLDVDGNIKARDKISSTTFESGFAGSGWRIETGSAGSASFTIDDLTVRGTMNVYELLIHQIRATNGSLFISNTGKVISSSHEGSNHYSMSFDTGSGYGHSFRTGDLIRAQRFVPSTNGSGSEVFKSDLHIISVEGTGSLLAALSGSDTPQIGYEYVRIGSTKETDRQGSIYLTADDDNAPFIDVVDTITAHSQFNTSERVKVRMGKLDGITTSATFGSLEGYGFYASGSAYLEGSINATAGEIGGFGINLATISSSNNNLILRSTGVITGSDVLFDGGTIGGFVITENAISSSNGNLSLKSNGQITASAVSMSGTISATSGLIGGWTIGTNQLSAGPIRLNSSPGTEYFEIGDLSSATDVSGDSEKGFFVDVNGNVLLKNATEYVQFNGGKVAIQTDALKISDGNLTISGTISSSVGNIGGFTIDGANLKSSGDEIVLSGDGSGKLASGKINWDTSGNTYISGSVVIGEGFPGRSGVNLYGHQYSTFEVNQLPTIAKADVITAISINETAGIGGGKCLQVTSDGSVLAGDGWMYFGSLDQPSGSATFPVQGGHKYLISAYVSCSATSHLNIDFAAFATSGSEDMDYPRSGVTWDGSANNRVFNNNTDWHRISASFTADANTVKARLRFDADVTDASTTRQVLFDNIMVEEIDTNYDWKTYGPSNFGNPAVTYIDGASITTGKIQSNNFSTSAGSEFNLNDGTFKLGGSSNPDLQYDGSTLTAAGTLSSSVGNIGGFTIGSSTIKSATGELTLKANGQLTGSAVSMSGTIVSTDGDIGGFTIGSTSIESKTGTLKLKSNGQLTASAVSMSGTITADSGLLGGWTIGDSTLTGGDVTLDKGGDITVGTSDNVARISATDSNDRIWVGAATRTSAPFRVSREGALTATGVTLTGNITATAGDFQGAVNAAHIKATSGSIGGFKIDTTSISSSNGALQFKSSGQITASAVSMSGTIVSEDGLIGGWSISNNTIASPSNNIKLIAGGNPYISIGGAGWRGDGIQLQYNSGDPRVHIGNSSAGLTFDGTDIHITSSKVNISGIISSSEGNIGGFTLGETAFKSADLFEISASQKPGELFISSSNFKLTNQGQITASAVSMSGTISATSGDIGGFTIGSEDLSATNFSINPKLKKISLGSGTDIVIIDGDDGIHLGHGTFASAPFRVSKAGKLTATDANIIGDISASSINADSGSIGGFQLTGNTISPDDGNASSLLAFRAEGELEIGRYPGGGKSFILTTIGETKEHTAQTGQYGFSINNIQNFSPNWENEIHLENTSLIRIDQDYCKVNLHQVSSSHAWISSSLKIGVEGHKQVSITTSSISMSRGDLIVGGNIKAPNIGTGTDNSVVIYDSDGSFKTDEIDSKVWGSNLIEAGTATQYYIPYWSDSGETLSNSPMQYSKGHITSSVAISSSAVATSSFGYLEVGGIEANSRGALGEFKENIDTFYVGHASQATYQNYALSQTSAGATTLNAKTGKTVTLGINGNTGFTLSAKMTSSMDAIQCDGTLKMLQNNKIFFDSLDTYIMADSSGQENMEIGADNDINLKPDEDVYIYRGTDTHPWIQFDGSSNRVQISEGSTDTFSNSEALAPLSIVSDHNNDSDASALLSEHQVFIKNVHDDQNTYAGIAFDVGNQADNDSVGAAIRAIKANSTAGYHHAHLGFFTNNGGSNGTGDDGCEERIRITNSGSLLIGTDHVPSSSMDVTISSHSSKLAANEAKKLVLDGDMTITGNISSSGLPITMSAAHGLQIAGQNPGGPVNLSIANHSIGYGPDGTSDLFNPTDRVSLSFDITPGTSWYPLGWEYGDQRPLYPLGKIECRPTGSWQITPTEVNSVMEFFVQGQKNSTIEAYRAMLIDSEGRVLIGNQATGSHGELGLPKHPTEVLQVDGNVSASGNFYGYLPQIYMGGAPAANLGTGEEFLAWDMTHNAGGYGNTHGSGARIIGPVPFDGYIKKLIVRCQKAANETIFRVYKAGDGTDQDALDDSGNRIVDGGVTLDINAQDTSFTQEFDSGPGGTYSFSAGEIIAISSDISNDADDMIASIVLMYKVE